MVIVYRLIDPRDRSVRYIGQTRSDLVHRLSAHMSEAKWSHSAKSAWIRELRLRELRPEVEPIESVPDKPTAYDREAHWIRHHRAAGDPLTNGPMPPVPA
jgi:hypothetical protein